MGAKKELVEHFNLGINTIDFKPLEKDLIFAKSLGILPDDTVVVFIGTIYPFAGLLELVSNFSKMEKQISNLKLLIVGGGPSYKKLVEQVTKNNLKSKIILTNFKPQKDVSKYISLADICINPFEINYVTNSVLPTKILEYFACGKPVLSTPLIGTKQLLPNEKYGISYSSSKDFIKILSSLLLNKINLEKLGKNGLEYVQKNHDWEILSKQLLQKFNVELTQ
jgi:glycosyltransferase involved in cell wall biosynthesis